jgi:hypothetical protein
VLSALEQTKPTKIITLDQALAAASSCRVVDYAKFEGTHARRTYEKEQFLADKKYVPEFDYPHLLELSGIENAIEIITQSLKVINENIHVIGWDAAELYIASLIFNLKRAQLIQASAAMNANEVESSTHTKALKDFKELTSELYGDMHESAYFGIMKTEYERAKHYVAQNELADEIKQDVMWALDFAKKHTNEERLISPELVKVYRPKVLRMYKNILKTVPEDSVFNAHECAEIMNKALETSGLTEYGWRAVVDSRKTSPATQGEAKRIYLPADTVRTTEQLRGLILHEQEVHARRYQNGSHFSQFSLLSSGTAEYLPVEEGLGTIMALLAAPDESSPIDRARTRYMHVGLALGTGSEPRDARQVFEITWRILALQQNPSGSISDEAVREAKEQTYVHIENIFRGTDCSTPGVVYSKAKVYYEGLLKASKYLQSIKGDSAAFVRMYLGKYNHTDTTETAHIMRIIKSA